MIARPSTISLNPIIRLAAKAEISISGNGIDLAISRRPRKSVYDTKSLVLHGPRFFRANADCSPDTIAPKAAAHTNGDRSWRNASQSNVNLLAFGGPGSLDRVRSIDLIDSGSRRTFRAIVATFDPYAYLFRKRTSGHGRQPSDGFSVPVAKSGRLFPSPFGRKSEYQASRENRWSEQGALEFD